MTDAPNGAVTVVVSPRDSFSQSLRCLDRLLESTPSSHRIVYVDGGSPDPIARALATRARDADFALLRSDCLLTPNGARNLGLELVRSETEPAWTAFVDNDSYVEPGWVEALRACGEETGAAAVVPHLKLERAVAHARARLQLQAQRPGRPRRGLDQHLRILPDPAVHARMIDAGHMNLRLEVSILLLKVERAIVADEAIVRYAPEVRPRIHRRRQYAVLRHPLPGLMKPMHRCRSLCHSNP